MKDSALIFLGAGCGGVSRFWIGHWIVKMVGATFPWGTFAINITGSLLIGIFFGLQPVSEPPSPARLLIVVGFLGGYTTFSSFSYETLALFQKQAYTSAIAYALGSLVLGLFAVWLGHSLGQRLSG